MALVLLDRDGVLNQDRPSSVRAPDELVMIPRAGAAVARLNRAGIRVAVVTNQSVVGRGLIDEAMLARIHDTLAAKLAEDGARLDALLVAPDAPDAATDRRKPGPGMLNEALAQFGQRPDKCPMIGDALRDLEAAKAAGCPRVLVRTGKGRATEADGWPADLGPVSIHDDLWHAVEAIVSGRIGSGRAAAER